MDATWKYTPATTKKSTCVDVEAQISLVNSLINNIYIYCSLHELCHAPVLLCSVINAMLPTALRYTTLHCTAVHCVMLYCTRTDHLPFSPFTPVSTNTIMCAQEGDQLREGGSAQDASCIQPNIDRAHAAARSFSALSSLGERWATVTQVVYTLVFLLLCGCVAAVLLSLQLFLCFAGKSWHIALHI